MADSLTPRTDAAIAITVRGLYRHFGAVRAIDGVDLSIAGGELFGLIGHNGAGKSTLFRLMLGLLRPSAGCVEVNGIDVAGSHFREVRRAIGYLPENVVFYDNLSGLETLRFFARLKGADGADCATLLARVGLAHAARRRLREYSKGMRQRLGLAQALLGRPRLLFLDEPTTGLDPAGIRDFYATLRELQQDGVTIVLSSHILAEIQQRVDRLALMMAGRIHAIGSVQSLRTARELPLRIEATLRENTLPGVRAALAALPVTLQEIDACTLAIDCPQSSKLAVLAALSALGGTVLDIGLHEPSLEDMLFGINAEIDDA